MDDLKAAIALGYIQHINTSDSYGEVFEKANDALLDTHQATFKSAGVKHDTGKPSMALLPGGPLLEIAKVLDFGAKKYAPDNWRGGMKWRRLISASLRHVYAFSEGQDLDPETQLSHLAHACCCLLFLLEYTKTHTEKDDRYEQRPSPENK